MRFLLGFTLIIGGMWGLGISLLGSTVVSSSLLIINGLELSIGLAVFSVVALVNGLFTLFSTR